jgi:hypothetical protein
VLAATHCDLSATPVAAATLPLELRRQDLLGGLIHEYQIAA